MNKFSVWADGSSGGNSTGAIGWGWIIVYNDNQVIASGAGGAPVGTNNIAELTGAIEGVEALLVHPTFTSIEESGGMVLELVSDSQYVLGLATGSFSPTKNVDLADKLASLCRENTISARWVRGHNGDILNEMCDRLAKLGKGWYQPPKETRSNRKKTQKQARKKAISKKKEEQNA